MAQALSATVTINHRESSTEGDRALQDKTSLNETFTFVEAAGALGVTKVFSDNRTLNTTSEDLDLAGALESGLGTAVVAAKVKLIAFRWNGLGTFKVDGGVSLGAVAVIDGSITVGPGGLILIVCPDAAGMAIVAGTADLLTITTTGAGDYDVIFGCE